MAAFVTPATSPSDRRRRRYRHAGSLLAGVDESPGDVVLYQGERFKEYRGMGSIGAMRDRASVAIAYFQEDVESMKLIAEGVEAQVPYKGALAALGVPTGGGLRSAMGYVGAPTIHDMQEKSRFVRRHERLHR